MARRWRYPRSPSGSITWVPPTRRNVPRPWDSQRPRLLARLLRPTRLIHPPWKSAQAVAPGFVPQVMRRAARLLPSLRRRDSIDPPWTTRAQPPARLVQSRIRTIRISRRGDITIIPPTAPQAATQALPPEIRRQPGRRGFLARRGDITIVPPTQQAAVTPGFVPQVLRRAAELFVSLRRRRFAEPPWTARVQPPPRMVQARVRPVLISRHGRVTTVPPAAPVGSAGPVVPPPYRQTGRRGFIARRGELTWVPLVGQAPQATPSIPQQVRARLRVPSLRRRAFAQPPWTAPRRVPPMVAVQRRTRAPRVSRGRFAQLPGLQALSVWLPPILTPRRTRTLRTSRARFVPLRLVGAAVVPPTFGTATWTIRLTPTADYTTYASNQAVVSLLAEPDADSTSRLTPTATGG